MKDYCTGTAWNCRSLALGHSHWPGDLRGSAVAALGFLAADVGFGMVAFAPLGLTHLADGVAAAFLAVVVGSLVPALVRGAGAFPAGPHSAQMLIVAALVATLVGSSAQTPSFAHIAFMVGLCVALAGLIQMAFGLLRLGRVIKFTPLPVLSGFFNGVALSMALAAFKGIAPLGAAYGVTDMAVRVLFAGALLAFMAWSFRRWPQFHWSLAGLVGGLALFYLLNELNFAAPLGERLPQVENRLPPLLPLRELWLNGVHQPWPEYLHLLAPPAFALAIFNSLESLVTANHQDTHSDIRHDANRVLFGQGLANVVGGLLGALPSAPSYSRLTISRQAGSATCAAALIYAFAVALLVIFAAPLLAYIPKLVVSVVMLYLAYTLIDAWSRKQVPLWLLGKGERHYLDANLLVMGCVMLLALAFNLVVAMAAGMVIAMFLFVRSHSQSIVSRVLRGDVRHSVVTRPEEQMALLRDQGGRIALVELDGPLFFGSADGLLDEMERLAQDARYVILDFRRVNDVEMSGAGMVQRIGRMFGKQGIRLSMAAISPAEERGRMLLAASPHNHLPLERWHADADLALEAVEDELLGQHGLHHGDSPERDLTVMDILRGMSKADIDVLLSVMKRTGFHRGDTLFHKGDEGDELYVVVRGSVEIHLPLAGDGVYRRLAEFRPGIVFGEMAILQGGIRSADAVAVSEVLEVLSLSRSALEQLRRDHPAVAYTLMHNISRQMATRLAATNAELRYALGG